MKHRFVSKKMIKYVREIVRMYGVRMVCTKRTLRTEADCVNEIIYVVPNLIEEDFISGAMHELQHILNKRNGKYPAYHCLKGVKAEYRATILHGYQAERYTDIQARKLHNILFPKFRYSATYLHPFGKWLFDVIHVTKVKREYAKHFKRF
jgi:hypothetical protein